jgi:hypothetical protein
LIRDLHVSSWPASWFSIRPRTVGLAQPRQSEHVRGRIEGTRAALRLDRRFDVKLFNPDDEIRKFPSRHFLADLTSFESHPNILLFSARLLKRSPMNCACLAETVSGGAAAHRYGWGIAQSDLPTQLRVLRGKRAPANLAALNLGRWSRSFTTPSWLASICLLGWSHEIPPFLHPIGDYALAALLTIRSPLLTSAQGALPEGSVRLTQGSSQAQGKSGVAHPLGRNQIWPNRKIIMTNLGIQG